MSKKQKKLKEIIVLITKTERGISKENKCQKAILDTLKDIPDCCDVPEETHILLKSSFMRGAALNAFGDKLVALALELHMEIFEEEGIE